MHRQTCAGGIVFVKRQRTAMRFDDKSGEIQPKTGAACIPRARRIAAKERFTNFRALLVRQRMFCPAQQNIRLNPDRLQFFH